MKFTCIFLSVLFFLFTTFSVDAKKPDRRIEWNNDLSSFRDTQIETANKHVVEAQKFTTSVMAQNRAERIDELKTAGDYMQKAIACYAAILIKAEKIGDKQYRESLSNLRENANATIQGYQAEIRDIEHHIRYLEICDQAQAIIELSKENESLAASYVLQYAFPSHLNEIDASIVYLTEASKLYQDAADGYNQVFQLLTPYTYPAAEESKRNLATSSLNCKKEAADCKRQADEWPIKKQSRIQMLKEELSRLENVPKQKMVILQELIDVEAADEKELFALKVEAEASRHQSKSETSKPFIESFHLREERRKEHFFTRLALLPNKSNPMAILKNYLSRPAPYAIPLDGQNLTEEVYNHYKGQFYRILVETSAPVPHFTIKVLDEDQVIWEEKISLPSINSPEWNTYLTEEGMLIVPELGLKSRYGLELRLKIISEKQFLLAVKGDSLNQFSLHFEEQSLYTFSYNEPPPWQLEVLRKPVASTVQPGINSSSIKIYKESSSFTKLVGDELLPHQLLNDFVKELKNDPLLIAQYVQNEINLLDPFQFQTSKGIEAPLLQKSALGTFLEGEGNAWEQCALLVYLLQEAGFKALYAQAFCHLPTKYVEQLLFTQLAENETTTLYYPFVLLELSKNNCISLFPWMKNIQISNGHNLYSLMPDEYASANRWIQKYLSGDGEITKHIELDGNDTAGVLFIRFVEEQLKTQGLSIQDVGIHRTLVKQPFSSWEEFPRPVIENAVTYVSLPSDFLAYIDFEVCPSGRPQRGFKKRLSLPFLNGRSFAIDFPSDNKATFSLKEGWNNANIPIPSKGSPYETIFLNAQDKSLDITASYQQKDVQWTSTLSIAKGTKAALCLCFGGSSIKTTSLFAKPYLDKKQSQDNLFSLLAFTGAHYFEKCIHAEKQLAPLHEINRTTYFGLGLAKFAPDTTSDLKFPQVDMHFKSHFPSGLTLENLNRLVPWTDFQALTCADFSSNEHQVIQDVFDDKSAISTIKLLKIAHEAHQKKRLEGAGFLVLTANILAAAEKNPYLASLQFFPHLTDFSLEKTCATGKSQWDIAGQALKTGSHSVALMTPAPISNEISPTTGLPSYTGMGTLIFSPLTTHALISDSMRTMNGGFGAGLPKITIEQIFSGQWKELPTQNNFSFQKTDHQLFNKLTFHSLGLATKSYYQPEVRSWFKGTLDLVADPVDIVSGAFYIDEVDLSLLGPFPLQIRRNYSNQSPVDSILGYGWKLSLNPYLFEEDDKLFAAEEDGTVIVYRLNEETSTWTVSPEDNPDLRNFNQRGIGGIANPFHAYIEKNDETHLLYSPDGSKRIFQNNLLKKWINSAGHALSFNYDGQTLTSIESSNKSYIGFKYNHAGKIAEAYAKDGRRIYYYYNTLGDLTEVRLPNDARVGYTYDNSHQIVRETHAHGRALENTYDGKKG